MQASRRPRSLRTDTRAQILVFIQALLDSSFLVLLSYPPAHHILREILSIVEPELEFVSSVEQLRGPLEPFVKEHARFVREAAHGPDAPDPSIDWRRRRKEAHEQAAITVGVYRVEELVL